MIEVEVQFVLPFFVTEVSEHRSVGNATCVEYRNVDPTEVINSSVDECFNVCLLGCIACDEVDVIAATQFGHCSSTLFCVSATKYDLCAFIQISLGNAKTDAASAGSNNCDHSVKLSHQMCSFDKGIRAISHRRLTTRILVVSS